MAQEVRFLAAGEERVVTTETKTGQVHVTVGDKTVAVTVEPLSRGLYRLVIEGKGRLVRYARQGSQRWLHVGGRVWQVERAGSATHAAARVKTEGVLRAVMPGIIRKVMVKEGDAVAEGQGLVILEAMKMENEVRAPHDATIRAVRVATGDKVEGGQVLIELESPEGKK